MIHYGLFYGCGIFGSPEKEVSIGLHEPVGPCNEYTSVQTVLGMVSASFILYIEHLNLTCMELNISVWSCEKENNVFHFIQVLFLIQDHIFLLPEFGNKNGGKFNKAFHFSGTEEKKIFMY